MPEDVIHYPFTASNPMVSGKTVTRIPVAIATGPAVFTVSPKINREAGSGILRDEYTDRFDDPRYYAGDTAS